MRSSPRWPSWIWVWIWVLPLVVLWWGVIDHLRLEWKVNPQYGYGWAVPLLCLYLLWQRISNPQPSVLPPPPSTPLSVFCFQFSAPSSHLLSSIFYLLFALLALSLLPTRLILEACSDWRTLSWGLGLEAVGLTLFAIYWMGGVGWLRQLAFPVCYFLVAVPWLSGIEGPVIQGLTRLNATLTVEALNLLGYAAIQHGNVIEVATGVVGIDEACSGIRSFQATLMISLFLGELYRLRAFARVGLCAAGFGLALSFNLARTTLLSWVAATRGPEAISKWHDPAGVTILVGCFIGLWLAALGLRRRTLTTRPAAHFELQTSQFSLPLVFLLWLLAVEAGVAWWYHRSEVPAVSNQTWVMELPRAKSAFKELPLSDATWRFLRYDEAWNATWLEPDGIRVQAVCLRWSPGRLARLAARSHTPEICLAAAGNSPVANPDPVQVEVGGLTFPFRVYQATLQGRPAYVYYCLWSDDPRDVLWQEDTYRNRLSGVLRGVRNRGQRSLEIVIQGAIDKSEAENMLRRLVATIVKVAADAR